MNEGLSEGLNEGLNEGSNEGLNEGVSEFELYKASNLSVILGTSRERTCIGELKLYILFLC